MQVREIRSELVFLRDFSVGFVVLVFFILCTRFCFPRISHSVSLILLVFFLLSSVSVPPAAVCRCDYHNTRIKEV